MGFKSIQSGKEYTYDQILADANKAGIEINLFAEMSGL